VDQRIRFWVLILETTDYLLKRSFMTPDYYDSVLSKLIFAPESP